MQSLSERIIASNNLLAPYAVPIEGQLGRVSPEIPDETRFPFQRDRDRIIHSLAFRRLKGKTQVFIATVGDHYRTRLTHSMEVAQISRDIARTLALNEDLSECIALAHDLGHPPFGHAGEQALDSWMRLHGAMFEHNAQSLRIVTFLESHSALAPGLNLNAEVLEGLMKHRTPHDAPDMQLPRLPSLEAQVVNIADEIAYTGHDCDDGLRAELFTLEELSAVPLIRRVAENARARGTSLRGALIHALVSDLYLETEQQLALQQVTTLRDVYESVDAPVRFSEEMKNDLQLLRTFLWDRMYMHPTVRANAERGQKIIQGLCEAFFAHPTDKIQSLMERYATPLLETVKDYVAGMTDAYAEEILRGDHR